MNRRSFTEKILAISAGSIISPLFANANVNDRYSLFEEKVSDKSVLPLNDALQDALPDNIKALINNILAKDYRLINTDWFGSIQIEGLLRFGSRGYKKAYAFSKNWFDYHVEHDKKLTDDEYYKQYEGNKARILRDGPLAFVIYSANLGVAFPVYQLYLINHSRTERQVCLDVADAILHYAARDRFGMLAHDDYNFTEFAIPDTAYWATRANAIAAKLSTNQGVANIYWKQAIYQLDQGIKYFLDKNKGLVRTGLFKGEPGRTYWCRSQGWLLWAIAGLLRYLPSNHQDFERIADNMKIISDGLKKYQAPSGAFRVLVDDPTSPEEVTGTAMILSALKEGTRKRWINSNCEHMLNNAWKYVQSCVDVKGNIKNAYTGWAVTAENGDVNRMDERFMGWVPGTILLAADEMSR